jgi:hypothetical protein
VSDINQVAERVLALDAEYQRDLARPPQRRGEPMVFLDGRTNLERAAFDAAPALAREVLRLRSALAAERAKVVGLVAALTKIRDGIVNDVQRPLFEVYDDTSGDDAKMHAGDAAQATIGLVQAANAALVAAGEA